MYNEFISTKVRYRELFVDIALEIDKVIDSLDSDNALAYLNLRLDKIKKEYRECLYTSDHLRKCNCCGLCCKFAVSEFSYEQLKQKANNGDKFAAQFVTTFVPYNDLNDVKNVCPEYVNLLEDFKESDCYFYHCPKVTEDNKCSDYENRPQICRDYPDNPLQILPKSCGFCDWKLQLESVSLKLNAEIEIINFYITKIKESIL